MSVKLTSAPPPQEGSMTELLSAYELGRLVTLIEWVVRGGKPIASCASRYVSEDQRAALRNDLLHAIDVSGESEVKGYILALPDGQTEFGVYQNDWALQARIYLLRDECPEWLQGIVFGYTAQSVAQFNDVFGGLESTLLHPDGANMVETVRPGLERSHTHSIQYDRCQRLQRSDQ